MKVLIELSDGVASLKLASQYLEHILSERHLKYQSQGEEITYILARALPHRIILSTCSWVHVSRSTDLTVGDLSRRKSCLLCREETRTTPLKLSHTSADVGPHRAVN